MPDWSLIINISAMTLEIVSFILIIHFDYIR